jgi:hypothetical protein
MEKGHTTEWPKETRGHPLYVFCLLAMVLCVFENPTLKRG